MRIEWSRAGDALLTCVDGTLRRHVDGASTIIDGPNLVDARWRADGSIVSLDRRSRIHHHANGQTTQGPARSEVVISNARLAASDHYCVVSPYHAFVATFEGREVWSSAEDFPSHGNDVLVLSDDARFIAFAGQTRGTADFHFQRKEGRNWMVFDTKKDAVTDRGWMATARTVGVAQVAFDAKAKRVAIALPAPGASIGAIRIGKDEAYPQDHTGGARAVALDDRGILAAYAYPTGIGPRRLRIDYLERGVKGGSRITTTDTLWIDPDLEDIVALAFDHASRRIACLGASGAVEVVPVPLGHRARDARPRRPARVARSGCAR